MTKDNNVVSITMKGYRFEIFDATIIRCVLPNGFVKFINYYINHDFDKTIELLEKYNEASNTAGIEFATSLRSYHLNRR